MAVDRPSERQTLRQVERLVDDALPPGWSLHPKAELAARNARPDALWALKAPDGTKATFIVEVKRTLLGPRVDQVLKQLEYYGGAPLVVTPYLGPTLRASLANRGVSYADATGNLRLVSSAPGLFVERAGATKDPWRSDDALRSLRGRGAGRAVRAVIDFPAPFGVRELAQRAKVPLGSLSRVIDLLTREGLVTRDDSGAVTTVDWAGTIRRWTHDYDFARSNQITTFLEPRGLEAAASRILELKSAYAATGVFAAQHFAPIAPARQLALYVDDIARTAERLRLRPADAGANVVLAEPYDPVVFDRATVRDHLRIVAASQLAVDLLTGPGREPSEGDEFLTWMAANEDAWRG